MQSLSKQIAYKRGTEMAVAILAATDEMRTWAELLKSKDENIKLKALIYLSDRAYGKPTQEVRVEANEGHKFGFEPATDNAAETVQ
jgi:hypothetical protein